MSVIEWLLNSDPSIRWQAMRDLSLAPTAEVAAERAKIATHGWGAALLAAQSEDGTWPGNPAFPNTPPCALYCCCTTWVSTRPLSKPGALWAESERTSHG